MFIRSSELTLDRLREGAPRRALDSRGPCPRAEAPDVSCFGSSTNGCSRTCFVLLERRDRDMSGKQNKERQKVVGAASSPCPMPHAPCTSCSYPLPWFRPHPPSFVILKHSSITIPHRSDPTTLQHIPSSNSPLPCTIQSASPCPSLSAPLSRTVCHPDLLCVHINPVDALCFT